MKIAAIVQARMTSTRLPGKVMKVVLGKTLLEYQIERIKKVKLINQIIVATTTNSEDDSIVSLCEQLDIPYFRGSEADVLSRYYEAATKFNVDIIVRLTSDCPLIDPQVINETIREFLMSEMDYISNSLVRTYPRGMDTEVFSYQKLKEINELADKLYEREHVTPYFYEHPNLYTIKNVVNSKDYSDYRLTVDTAEDFCLIKKIIHSLYPTKIEFNLSDIINVLETNPSWVKINADIEQKRLEMEK
jgi:spore coat polysaccharide biosynthesis protein SpsF